MSFNQSFSDLQNIGYSIMPHFSFFKTRLRVVKLYYQPSCTVTVKHARLYSAHERTTDPLKIILLKRNE